MTTIGTTLAVGGSVALVLAIAGLIYLAVKILNHVRGCVGGSTHGCSCCYHAHTSGMPDRMVFKFNVDEVRDVLWRILDLNRLVRRLNRHRRDIDQLRRDHDQLGRDHDNLVGDVGTLARDHNELRDRVATHLALPHDGADYAAMLDEHKRETAETIRELRETITRMETDRLNHHHLFHTPAWILSAVLGVVAFVIMYVLDLTVISHNFVNHFALVVKHVTLGMINFDWSWAKLGLAFAVGMSIFVAAAVITSMFHTERTGPAVGHAHNQQVP